MIAESIKTIAICGSGLAGVLCAAALANSLPDTIKLILIDMPGSDETDIFYGTVTSPTTYDFLLSIGITEPELLPNTKTTFSLGTRFSNWGKNKRSWIQSFHKPLPLFDGVNFHHYLTRLRNINPESYELEPYIMSAQAAYKNVFAHPSQDKATPLSNVEYGYHFLPKEWREFLNIKITHSRVKKMSGDIKKVQRENNRISLISLSDGKTIEADLFIDCSGLNPKLGKSNIQSKRRLKALESFKPQDKILSSARFLESTDYGWRAETAFQDRLHSLSIFDPSSEEDALSACDEVGEQPIEAPMGYVEKPWQGNCLSLGHKAAILEPLTPAPIMLLQRDIERLIELIPHSKDMTVEAQEYNRRFSEDYLHASLFQRGLFEDESRKKNAYSNAATADIAHPKLVTKITQFHSRGANVQYDLEPFGIEDWTQQHFGMGRLPSRYDPLADRADEHQITQTLQQMRTAHQGLIQKMPPHHIYMKKLLEYFRKKYV